MSPLKTEDTLAAINEIKKAFTQSTSPTSGLTAYPLDAPAKLLYPTITPLRNRIPRVSGQGGIQASWRAITGVNTANAGIGVSEGNRGVIQTSTTADYVATYKAIGLDDTVTFEAELAAEGFDDVRARAVQGLLRGLMIGEEKAILGGNNSLALNTTPTPNLTAATSGGSLPSASSSSNSVICVAMTLDAYLVASLANGLPLSANRTLADGTVEAYNQGTAQKSANATVATTGSGSASIIATVTPVPGAVAYAWFYGATGSEALVAITTVTQVVITAAAAGGAQLASAGFTADKSQNSQLFDGLLTQIMKSGSNAYVNTLAAGSTLTADGSGGIVEIDTALKAFWDNYRLSPTDIYVSSQEQSNISKKILTSGSNGAQRFVFSQEQGVLAGGVTVRSYLNKFSMDGAQNINISLHPNLPAGTMVFYTETLPYPLSNVSNVLQIRARRDYYQIDWPIVNRKYQYGVYADEVLQCYFPPAFGVINNISNG